jgi:sulfite reductase (ferredoxin)
MNDHQNLQNVGEADLRDIVELDRRIAAFRQGEEDEERFRHYRLTRGVYGQRQTGVQMFRIKIPFGRLTSAQLACIADISEKYATGNLHLTTRQNVQLHFVKLEDSPKIWAMLAESGLTARESCGNTVRNLTASAKAGIDPDEPFDVSPYVLAAFQYFLRNPICQDMGRKIKPAFSSSEKDSAFTYFHDFGFIPRVRIIDGVEQRGFKVVVGGGLGAVSIVASTVYEFLEDDRIIPFMEACLRVFDRYGEREKRMKARMKFLIQSLGLEAFLQLVETESLALKNQRVAVDIAVLPESLPESFKPDGEISPVDPQKYDIWLRTNVFEQKQKGCYGVQLRIRLGNIHASTARRLASIVPKYAADDLRLTVNQGILLRFVSKEALPVLFNELETLGLADYGFDTIADVTACPGTDTCALGVTNSTGLAGRLEEVILAEYPELIEESDIRIKISGCMNSCGQHMAAHIGFHGSSLKRQALVVPAMQVVLGGGVDPAGRGFVAEKIVKLPTRRIPDALRLLLDDFKQNSSPEEYFNDYFRRQGKKYFYDLLNPLADLSQVRPDDLFDWGQDEEYLQSIGVGECAGVTLDVVGTIIGDAREKAEAAVEALDKEAWADSIYNSYTAFIIAAKALLLARDVKCNTHAGIIADFQKHCIGTGDFPFEGDFGERVLAINRQEPEEGFAREYRQESLEFVRAVIRARERQLETEGANDKVVVGNYYKA